MFKYFCAVLVCIFIAIIAYSYNYSHNTLTNEYIRTNIMNYSMVDVIKRCQKNFDYTDEDMVMLERELKRYLILCAIKENQYTPINMYSEHVDNLWHSFILFTKEYANFCKNNAHQFIHHSPKTDTSPMTPEKQQKANLEFLAFVDTYEKLFKEEIDPIWLLDRC